MRCHICNTVLQPNEIVFNKKLNKFEPCRVCLEDIGQTYNDFVEEEDEDILFKDQTDNLYDEDFS